MGLQDLLSRLSRRRSERASRQCQTYRELVAGVADGNEPKIDELERVLDETGKTPEQLQADVQSYLDRRRWAAELENEEMWQQELRELDRRQEKADRLLVETRDSCYAEGVAVREARQQVESKLAGIAQARLKLHNSSPDASRQAVAASVQQTGPLVARVDQIERELRDARAKLDYYVAESKKRGCAPNVGDSISTSRVRVDRLEGELAAATGRLEALRKESERRSTEALVP